MERIRRFFRFIELNTKLASLTPFFIGMAYVYYTTGRVNLFYTVFFAVDMMLFDIPVTMINNYLDKRRAGETPHFSKRVSLTFIFAMTAASVWMGLYLTLWFGPIVLPVGLLCFFVGIFYSFGPIPISVTPYGELAAGLVQGLCIIFLVAFINLPADYFAQLSFDFPKVTLQMDLWHLFQIFAVALPAVFCIANIMLSNNICDVERDVKNRRYTLPYYIGQDKALRLYKFIYAAAYLAVIASVIIRAVPFLSLATLFTLPLVWRNAAVFSRTPLKAKTFVFSIRNFILILAPYAATVFAGRFIG